MRSAKLDKIVTGQNSSWTFSFWTKNTGHFRCHLFTWPKKDNRLYKLTKSPYSLYSALLVIDGVGCEVRKTEKGNKKRKERDEQKRKQKSKMERKKSRWDIRMFYDLICRDDPKRDRDREDATETVTETMRQRQRGSEQQTYRDPSRFPSE